MEDLDEIIAHEGESTTVDFKGASYRPSQHQSFIKDILAMANADTSAPRYIILGVKHSTDGAREVVGLAPEEHVDPAIFDQLVRENIEPDLTIEYFVHVYDAARVGVLCLRATPDAPYLMRKDLGPLRRGDGFIRKGTHQTRLDRGDLERIYNRRKEAQPSVSVAFESSGTTKQVMSAHPSAPLPSKLAEERIRRILEERRQGQPPRVERFAVLFAALGGGTYEAMDTEALKDALRNVAYTYREVDAYTQFEEGASQIQLSISNFGDGYVDDVSIRITIQGSEGLVVSDRVYAKPSSEERIPLRMSVSFLGNGYPRVMFTDGAWRIHHKVGTLRHKLKTPAFGQPLRLKAGNQLIGKDILLDCTVMGRQLKVPVRESLVLTVGP